MLLLLDLPLVDSLWDLLLTLDKRLHVAVLLNEEQLPLPPVWLLVRDLVVTLCCLSPEDVIHILFHVVLFHA